MKARYYGELKLHDGSVVQIADRRAAEKINEEFEWLFKEATDQATKFTIRAVQCLFALKLGDRYGWSTDRLCRLLKDIAFEASLITDGETSVEDDLLDLITTDRGAVCQAYWHGEQFSGAAGKHAVAWRERPEPYEFWRDEVEERKE